MLHIPGYQDIERLALTHPEVHQALTLYNEGTTTFEESLLLMVVALAKNKEAIEQSHKEHLARHAVTVVGPKR